MAEPRGHRLQTYAPTKVPPRLDNDFLVWLGRELKLISAVQKTANWDDIANVPPLATAEQGAKADTAIQPGDDAARLGSADAPMDMVLTTDGEGGTAWVSLGIFATSLPFYVASGTFDAIETVPKSGNHYALPFILADGTYTDILTV